jgi:dTDP-4-amino-4,6-dideoxygalactose transaminase
MIRRCDLVPQYELYKEEIQAAINNVLESGRYTLGENVESFEKEFSTYIGCEYGIGVNSGTDALILAMSTIGIKDGDEIITTPFTAIPTYSAIRHVGAVPIFVDIDPRTFLIDISKVCEAITSKTKAIIPVHLFGNIVDIEKLRKVIGPDIFIIEDCAQAHGGSIRGKKAGSLGDLSAFSFYPTKNLGGYGDGGMVITNKSYYNEQLRKLRQYGMINKDEFILDGINSRLDEIQAAILRIKLKYLDSMNSRRSILASLYNKLLDSEYITTQNIEPNVQSVYHVYSIICKANRNDLVQYLEKFDIQSNIYYPVLITDQKGYKNTYSSKKEYLNAEQVSKSIIALPFYPEIDDEKISIISENINNYFYSL